MPGDKNGSAFVKNITIFISALTTICTLFVYGWTWYSWKQKVESTLIHMDRYHITKTDSMTELREAEIQLKEWVRKEFPVKQPVISAKISQIEAKCAELHNRLRELERPR